MVPQNQVYFGSNNSIRGRCWLSVEVRSPRVWMFVRLRI